MPVNYPARTPEGDRVIAEWEVELLPDVFTLCPECLGSGTVAVGPWGSRPPRKTCPTCHGARTIPPPV